MDLISVRDLETKDIEAILESASQIDRGEKDVDLNGRILATLFFEPSTRTKLSFQSAAMRSKMKVLDFSPESSSLKKGESFMDTIKTVSGYADVLAIRHPKEGSVRLASAATEKPVVNGGDGGNQHPTQTLIDLYSIKKTKGRIKGLDVTLSGDLKHARTMRSLVYGLAMFGANVRLVSPRGLEMDKKYLEEVNRKFGLDVRSGNTPEYTDADVLYVCRIQAERFADPYEAQSVQQKFMIKKSDLKDAREDMAILHPLPKVNEIDSAIDDMPQAKYFEQAHNGIPLRMAVLDHVLSR
ncbi:aspartate carbamoyltransferase [Candidatus Micrarchaeota archaeon]|nr:aspartate carbamoyltransferase [Candidatus Micrarchaeota archaeon]